MCIKVHESYLLCSVYALRVTVVRTQARSSSVRIHEGYPLRSQSYMEDEEVLEWVNKYDDEGYHNLPKWLKQELRARNLPIPTRKPTQLEMWETNGDAFDHRMQHGELTIKDYHDHYVTGTKRILKCLTSH